MIISTLYTIALTLAIATQLNFTAVYCRICKQGPVVKIIRFATESLSEYLPLYMDFGALFF